jgi:hypothetical protein
MHREPSRPVRRSGRRRDSGAASRTPPRRRAGARMSHPGDDGAGLPVPRTSRPRLTPGGHGQWGRDPAPDRPQSRATEVVAEPPARPSALARVKGARLHLGIAVSRELSAVPDERDRARRRPNELRPGAVAREAVIPGMWGRKAESVGAAESGGRPPSGQAHVRRPRRSSASSRPLPSPSRTRR